MAPNHETLKCSTIHVELMPIIALLSMQSFSFHNDMTHEGKAQPPPHGYSFIYFLCPKEAVKVSLVIEQQRKRSRKERGSWDVNFAKCVHFTFNRIEFRYYTDMCTATWFGCHTVLAIELDGL